MYDLIIIGSGPIGCEVASIVAGEGYDVLILEEHREIGRPVQCAGLISQRVLDITNVRKGILNKIKGINFFSPNGHRLTVKSDQTKGIVVDRAVFDKEIAKKAIKNGAEIALGNRVKDIKRNNKIEVKFKDKIERCKILIGADGANSIVRKKQNLPKPKLMLTGFQKEVIGLESDKEFINAYIGDMAPDFFAWVIPCEDTTLIGLCVHDTNSSARQFLDNFSKKFKISQTIRYSSGHIPLGLINPTYSDNVMLVGDAAAQVKPISGGGLYTGLQCAKECGKTALKALEKDDFSENILSEYQRLWQKKIGKELKNGMRLRKILYNFEKKEIEKLFVILDNPKLLNIVAEKGDMDYPSKLFFPVFKKSPKLIKFAPHALNSLI